MSNWLIRSHKCKLKNRYIVEAYANGSHFHENAKVKKIHGRKKKERNSEKSLRQHLFILVKKKKKEWKKETTKKSKI